MKIKLFALALSVAAAFAVAPASHAFNIKGINVDKVISSGKQVAQAAKDITPAEEHYIGRAVAANVLATYPLLDNAALTDYVNKVGATLAGNSELPYTYGGYHFAVLASDTPNAFACPGGFVFVTRGLMKLAKNEDELAGILAHEVAHVAHHDGIAAIKKSQWTKLGVDTAVEVGQHYAPNQAKALTGAFSKAVGDVTKKVLNNSYGAAAEKKADASALKYMHTSGYDPQALVSLLKTEESKGLGKGGYLSMQASPAKRVAWLESDITKNGFSGNVAAERTKRFDREIAKLR